MKIIKLLTMFKANFKARFFSKGLMRLHSEDKHHLKIGLDKKSEL